MTVGRVAQWLAIASSIILGAIVLIGWEVDSVAITQIRPIFPSMKFNAALCFLLSGVSLALLQLGKNTASRVVAALVASLGALTLSQDIFSFNAGIDLAFHAGSLATSGGVHPGRMAPLRALGVLLISGAIFVASIAQPKKAWLIAAQSSVMLALSVGLISLIGWATSENSGASWQQFSGVPVHAGTGVCLLAVALLMYFHEKFQQLPWELSAVVIFLAVGPLLVHSKIDGELVGILFVVTAVIQVQLARTKASAQRRSEALAIIQGDLTTTAELLERTAKMAKIGGWELDLATSRVTWSKETGRIHEVDDNYVAPKYDTGDQWYPPESWPTIKAAVETAIAEQKPYDLESKFITAKGRNIWVRVQGFPVVSEGKVIKLQGTFQDISERKQAELEIQFARESLGFGVWTFHPATGALEWDQAMYELYGVDPNDFFGAYSAWESCLTPGAKKAAVEELGLALSGQKEFNTEFQIQLKNGDTKYIAGRAVVVRNEKNEPVKMYGLNWDVTVRVHRDNELKAANVRLIHSAKLASLGEMAAGIAHEINNPLAIIAGSVGLLSRLKDDPARVASKIETIQKSCARIARIVKSLKKFSRSGEGKVVFKRHSLAAIAKETMILVEAHSNARETPVTLEVSTEAWIECDEVEIEQVLINLIHNGMDAVKELPDKWVKVAIFEDGASVVMRVSDSGSGIPEIVRNKIFDPFFTTKDVGEGTGLGLSVTKGILDGHNATISVLANAPNTCFEVRFPSAEATKNAA